MASKPTMRATSSMRSASIVMSKRWRRRLHEPAIRDGLDLHLQRRQRRFDASRHRFRHRAGGGAGSCAASPARESAGSPAKPRESPDQADRPQSAAAAQWRARSRAPAVPDRRRARSAGSHPSRCPSGGRDRESHPARSTRLRRTHPSSRRSRTCRSPPMTPATATGPSAIGDEEHVVLRFDRAAVEQRDASRSASRDARGSRSSACRDRTHASAAPSRAARSS